MDYEAKWEENKLILIPDESLKLATESEVTIENNDIKNKIQSFKFETTTYPEVIINTPQILKEKNQDIIITFNKPVTSLASVDDQQEKEIPVTITPEVEGEYEWLSTTTLRFRPSNGFDLGYIYTVNVNNELIESTDGLKMQEPFEWSIEREKPILLSENSLGGGYGLSERISIEFNVAVQLDINKIKLVPEYNQGYDIQIILSQETKGSSNYIYIQPGINLNPITNYQIIFSGDLRALETNSPLGEERRVVFSTVDYPEADINVSINDSTGLAYHSEPSISFTTEMNVDSLVGNILVNGKTLTRDESYWYSGDRYVSLKGYNEPSTSYNIQVLNGNSADGLGLKYPVSFSYKTKDYDPSIEIVGGERAMYNASNPLEVWFSSTNYSSFNYKLYKLSPNTFKSGGYIYSQNGNYMNTAELANYFSSSMISSWSVDNSEMYKE
ncbi:MAG: Ig-like domain-containing protein [Candidatus Dojkabacteria bacterium]|nr:Ig-like domain-containing protein [Candidatus Dojkabacteria bacterium]